MSDIIQRAKEEFLKMINTDDSDPFDLASHISEMEKWGEYMIKKHPKADAEVIRLAVWLHDLGHYPFPTNIDHAIRG